MLALLAGEQADFATAEAYLLEALRRFPGRTPPRSTIVWGDTTSLPVI